MKTKIAFIFGLALVVILFSSFMVREKEETSGFPQDVKLLQSNKCFSGFISSLQKMEALIFVPKSRISTTQGLNLTLLSRDKTRILNKSIAEMGDEYVQVYPSDNPTIECSKAISWNFKNLEMVCYVKKEKVAAMSEQPMFKWDSGTIYLKIESTRTLRPEELQFKWYSSGTEWKDYVPVINNLTR